MKEFHIDNTNADDIIKYSKNNTTNTMTRRVRYGIMQREICLL